MVPGLKLFTYPLEDCHLEPGFPYRSVPVLNEPNPQWFEPVSSPEVADFIVFPVCLTDVGASHAADGEYVYSYLPGLPHFEQFPARHIFFLPGVDTWAPLFTSAVTFRTSLHRSMLDLNAVAIPYYQEQVSELLDYSEVVYHTIFAGFLGSWLGRVDLIRALSQTRNVNSWLKGVEKYHHHLSPEKRAEDPQAYREELRRTITVCCPRGAGLNSIRFFETLAAGRIPILISDNCVLPLEDQLDYSAFSLRLPEARIPEIGAFLADWFAKTPADKVARMCAAARQAWEEHLGPASQEELVVNALPRIKNANYRLSVAQMADVEPLRRATRNSHR